ncbi:hypothetical protein [Candidatus Blastococcus massiliensis]|uniref:hypothetical protein n=1 Tax=Candidatus Blastococcus massiliensis TaxID=1470358 RepID=UPI0009DFC08B|nr:hypothetical protein [Candidatus Blastococcus massiliensis]
MTEPASRSDNDRDIPPRMPRWVRVTAIVAASLVLLFLILKLTGVGGEHGPGRHMSGLETPDVVIVPSTETAGATTVR